MPKPLPKTEMTLPPEVASFWGVIEEIVGMLYERRFRPNPDRPEDIISRSGFGPTPAGDRQCNDESEVKKVCRHKVPPTLICCPVSPLPNSPPIIVSVIPPVVGVFTGKMVFTDGKLNVKSPVSVPSWPPTEITTLRS